MAVAPSPTPVFVASVPVSAPAPIAPVAPAGNVGWLTRCLPIVAEKTGYPQDMLELDLDLEADLGIDTVKQAETFQAIREAYDIPFRKESACAIIRRSPASSASSIRSALT